jgi:hypothetical protein
MRDRNVAKAMNGHKMGLIMQLQYTLSWYSSCPKGKSTPAGAKRKKEPAAKEEIL